MLENGYSHRCTWSYTVGQTLSTSTGALEVLINNGINHSGTKNFGLATDNHLK